MSGIIREENTVTMSKPQSGSKKLTFCVVMTAVIRTIFVTLNNFYCIPVHLFWLFLLQPLKLVSSKFYWFLEGIFFRWLLSMVAFWSYSAGYDIEEKGDDIWEFSQDRAVVMYNHQSTSDVPLIMASFNSKGNFFSSSVMWIMDRVFRMTNFGVVSITHGDFFIQAGKSHRDSSLLSLQNHLKNFYGPKGRKWIVLFPEGGFLVNRLPSSWRFGQKLGLPHLTNVSLPRSGALKVILDHTADNPHIGVKWVIDATVAYPEGKPLNLQTLIGGTRLPCSTVIHYRCYSVEHIPRDEVGLNNWLYERYIEKERMLAEYYHTGLFPDAPSPLYSVPNPLPPDVKLVGTLSQDTDIINQYLQKQENEVPSKSCMSNCNSSDQTEHTETSTKCNNALNSPSNTETIPQLLNNNSPKHVISSSRSPLYPETHRPSLQKIRCVPLKHDPIEFMLRHMFYVVSTYIACVGVWQVSCTLLSTLW